MAFAGARRRLSQHFRRFQVRRQADRMREDEHWALPDFPPEIVGFRAQQQRDALAEACRRFGVEPCGYASYGFRRKSIGAPVQGNGSISWLKIICMHNRWATWRRDGEVSAPVIREVERPSIVNNAEWSVDGIPWCALQFTMAPAAPAADIPALVRPLPNIDDIWLAQLKQMIGRIAAVPLTRWYLHPGSVARMIAQRFGARAPIVVDEWRTAHGDVNWSNVTTPHLALIDWEYWGAAPRGYDAATLLMHSTGDAALMEKIRSLFADDLDTQSGIVAQLYLAARNLNQIEAGLGDPRCHRPLEAEATRLLKR